MIMKMKIQALGLVLAITSAVGLIAVAPEVEIVNKSEYDIIYSTHPIFNTPDSASNEVLAAYDPRAEPARVSFENAEGFSVYYLARDPGSRTGKDVLPGSTLKRATFTPGKTVYVKFDRYGSLVPQQGRFSETQRGYSLENNVTREDISTKDIIAREGMGRENARYRTLLTDIARLQSLRRQNTFEMERKEAERWHTQLHERQFELHKLELQKGILEKAMSPRRRQALQKEVSGKN